METDNSKAAKQTEIVHGEADYDWLSLRYQLDEQARDRSLLGKACINSLDGRYLDLGGGCGANIDFLARQFGSKQSWVLVEKNRRLIDATAAYLASRDWTILSDSERQITAKLRDKVISIEKRSMDFVADPWPAGDHYELICANAVFDMLTESQLERLLNNIATISSKVYFTLHINPEIRFFPETSLDRLMIENFKNHMSRGEIDQAPLGIRSVKVLERLLKVHYVEVHSAPSVWRIRNDQQDHLLAKLSFIKQANLDTKENKPNEVMNWATNTEQKIRAKKLSIEVGHYDFFTDKS